MKAKPGACRIDAGKMERQPGNRAGQCRAFNT